MGNNSNTKAMKHSQSYAGFTASFNKIAPVNEKSRSFSGAKPSEPKLAKYEGSVSAPSLMDMKKEDISKQKIEQTAAAPTTSPIAIKNPPTLFSLAQSATVNRERKRSVKKESPGNVNYMKAHCEEDAVLSSSPNKQLTRDDSMLFKSSPAKGTGMELALERSNSFLRRHSSETNTGSPSKKKLSPVPLMAGSSLTPRREASHVNPMSPRSNCIQIGGTVYRDDCDGDFEELSEVERDVYSYNFLFEYKLGSQDNSYEFYNWMDHCADYKVYRSMGVSTEEMASYTVEMLDIHTKLFLGKKVVQPAAEENRAFSLSRTNTMQNFKEPSLSRSSSGFLT